MRLARHGTTPEVDELLHESPLTAGLDHPRLEVAGPIRGPSRRLGHRSESGGGQGRAARLGITGRCSDPMTPILIRRHSSGDTITSSEKLSMVSPELKYGVPGTQNAPGGPGG